MGGGGGGDFACKARNLVAYICCILFGGILCLMF